MPSHLSRLGFLLASLDHRNLKRGQKIMAPGNALVIGAKQGIGLNLAKKLNQKGWRVYASVRSYKPGKSDFAQISAVAAQILDIDVENEESIIEAATALGDTTIDLLIICAGVGAEPTDIWGHTAETFETKFRVNSIGPFLVAKHFRYALMRSEAGKIINLSSNMAILSQVEHDKVGGSIAYRMSKTALNQLTVSMSRAFAAQGTKVTVNSIHPGWIPTAMTFFAGTDDMGIQTDFMIDTIEKLGDKTGCFFNANGEPLPW